MFPSSIDLVHQLDWSLLESGCSLYTGSTFESQVCACVPVKCSQNLLKESTTFGYWCLKKEIGFLTCTKRNRISEAKSQNLIKRTLLFSLLCFYNSLLIQCYTHFIISQKTSCFKCKLMLAKVFSDWLTQTYKHETWKIVFLSTFAQLSLGHLTNTKRGE